MWLLAFYLLLQSPSQFWGIWNIDAFSRFLSKVSEFNRQAFSINSEFAKNLFSSSLPFTIQPSHICHSDALPGETERSGHWSSCLPFNIRRNCHDCVPSTWTLLNSHPSHWLLIIDFPFFLMFISKKIICPKILIQCLFLKNIIFNNSLCECFLSLNTNKTLEWLHSDSLAYCHSKTLGHQYQQSPYTDTKGLTALLGSLLQFRPICFTH